MLSTKTGEKEELGCLTIALDFLFGLTLYGMTRPHGRVEVFPVKVNFCAFYN